MTVRELLRRIDSREITEWEAYERAHGPLGNMYSNEALASIHEQLQIANALKGAEFGDENPIPDPEKYPRPGAMFDPPVAKEDKPDPDEVGLDDFMSLFK